MTDRAEKLKKHLSAMLTHSNGTGALESLGGAEHTVESLTPFATDHQEVDLALSGLEKVQVDDELDDEEVSALEAIVLPRERPVIDVLGDSFHEPPRPWKHLNLDPYRSMIEKAIPSVGRVEIFNHPTAPYGGTGFVAGPDLLMTNRHVAETFATGVGLKNIAFIPGRTPGIDFKQEVLPTQPIILQFERVEMIHPYWDCALVKVAGLPTERSSIVLDGREPDDLEDRDIVIIGYPAQDSRNDLDLQLRIFRGIFQRKRMQPGRVRQYRSIRSYNNVVEALTHDCSTLGGNSGSVVLDVTTGRVIGLHFAGVYLEVNFAVPTWALAEDAKVVDCGVSFHEPPAIGGPPLWNKQWLAADSGKAESEAPASGRAPGGASRPSTGSSLLGLDWYERIDDAILQDAIERDLQGTRQKLIEVIGQEAADEVIDDLSEPMEEGLFTPEPDPSLPEIIYLHGIMGSHLANHHGSGSRVWFNFLAFAKGNIAEKMTLEDDGFTDADPRFRLGADGHLRLKYAKATRRLRKKRFVVHEFSYDWRKPIESASNRLHGFIEQLVAANPGRRFVLVAHSMGGLVSSIYAQQHSNWLDRIDKAVFVGSPLGGSYAPIEAVLGVYPFFTTLAKLSRYDDLSELQELATTLPGLLEMMPNPELFADPVDYYVQSAWPDNVKLQQNWLDQSKDLKEKILSSPLLERTTGIVSREFGTISNVRSENARIVPGPRTGPGDGTVPIRAAAVTQLSDLYEATGKRHADMMNNTDIIKGVADIVRTGSTSALEKIRLEDIDFDEILPETEAIETTEDQLEGVRGRMEKGHLTAADVDWLFDPLVGAPPQ